MIVPDYRGSVTRAVVKEHPEHAEPYLALMSEWRYQVRLQQSHAGGGEHSRLIAWTRHPATAGLIAAALDHLVQSGGAHADAVGELVMFITSDRSPDEERHSGVEELRTDLNLPR